NIEEVIRNSVAVLSALTQNYEIVVINDGSTDNTKSVLEGLAKEIPQLKIFSHEKNLGIAETLKKVFLYPSKEWVFFIPGDGQIAPKEIYKLIPFTENYDYLIGKRAKRNDGFTRLLNAWIYNMVISVVALKRVTDIDSVVFYKRLFLNNTQLYAKSAFIHAELFIKARKNGARSVEAEIEHLPRKFGKSTGSNPGVILKTALDLLKLPFKPF
ncbi:MAG: glycosyltransferase family 2 protein, partial [Elusimicrobia bacterium]|nr:glycosyltransferase family 2 protein [Elusimicrobiota bacterium]